MEKIILAPGVSGNELSKSLAMHGVNTFNLRICGDKEMARMGLMRSGVSVTETFLNFQEENNVVAEAVELVNAEISDGDLSNDQGDGYFSNPSNSDIQQIANALRRMRSFVTDEDEAAKIEECLSKGEFMDKNNALISVYKKFIEIIESRNLMDSISLIRLSIAKCHAITGAEFYVLEEFPLSPIQKKLIEVLSGGNYKRTNLFELFKTDKIDKDNPLKINSIKNCYGAANEVETILDDIYRDKALDTCTVAVTDPKAYSQLFFDYAVLYNIPITFGCGIPIINSNPAKLLQLFNYWMNGGFYGADAINDMISSDVFHKGVLKSYFAEKIESFDEDKYPVIFRRVKEILGDIRFTNNLEENKKRMAGFRNALAFEEDALKKACEPYLEIMAEELAMNAEDFVKKYSYIRQNSETTTDNMLRLLDNSALNAIYDEMKILRDSKVDQSSADMIGSVLSSSVLKSRCEQGCLYVTSIDGAVSSIRDYLYVAGLSATKYPGSPTENYLLLDTDISLFEEEEDQLKDYTSDGKINAKKKKLYCLVDVACSLNNTINLSYAGLNVSELKKDNESSVIYEIYRKVKGPNATSKMLEADTKKVEYFEPAISLGRKVGENYNQGKKITQVDIKSRNKVINKCSLKTSFSPTSLDMFFQCARKFKLNYILGVSVIEEEDPFEIISAAELGSLIHTIMERETIAQMEKDEFLKCSGEYFDRYIDEHQPMVKQDIDKEKAIFLDVMELAFDMDPHNKAVLKEEDIEVLHEESGVKIHGYPDRVEEKGDGSVIIVDYKTGRKLKHVEDDINTCLQVVIYAYLMEKKGMKVSHCEYRYINLGETVKCKYDDEIKNQLTEKLKIFKKCMEENTFEIPETANTEKYQKKDEYACNYCKLDKICGKDKKIWGENK